MNNCESAELVLRLERRRLLRWRIAAVAMFVVACCASVGFGVLRHKSGDGEMVTFFDGSRPHIARLSIKGVIKNDVGKIVERIDAARLSKNVTGLLLVVDSPGGGVTGGERLHDAIARFAAVKPVSVSMGDLGASAAYMLSVPAQHLVARPSTLTGSIGVILERPDVSPLLGRWGISIDSITSGAMKDQTSPTSALTPGGRSMLQGLVNDLFDQFVQMVAAGRHLTVARVHELADGRPYTGQQALGLHLVDELGDEADARRWLFKKLKVNDRYPVVPLEMPSDERPAHWYSFILQHQRQSILGWLIGAEADVFLKNRFAGLWLDGPVALLQL